MQEHVAQQVAEMLFANDLPEDPGILWRENVLYLVSEVEVAISLGSIAWATEDAERISELLLDLTSAYRGQAGN